MEIGVLIHLSENIDKDFEKISGIGINSCQLAGWRKELWTDDMVETITKSQKKHNIKITAFWCGWSGPQVWDFYEGPHTLGIVPISYRYDRCKEIKEGSCFAKKLGISDIITHVGFLPEVPTSTDYNSLISALKDLAGFLYENGQNFLFETGQETPVTLKRTIQDIGFDNIGINLDPANLILYGKANPIDALSVFGEYVKGVHGKDGNYPTDGHNLGEEKRIGDGAVDYPRFIKKLKEVGYDGTITIEREITGDKQTIDIVYAKKYLEKLM